MDSTLALTQTTRAMPVPQVSQPVQSPAAVDDRRKDGDVPLPVPASLEQKGQVNKSRMTETALPGSRAVSEPERALKPYGVAMLPDRPNDSGNAETAPTDSAETDD